MCSNGVHKRVSHNGQEEADCFQLKPEWDEGDLVMSKRSTRVRVRLTLQTRGNAMGGASRRAAGSKSVRHERTQVVRQTPAGGERHDQGIEDVEGVESMSQTYVVGETAGEMNDSWENTRTDLRGRWFRTSLQRMCYEKGNRRISAKYVSQICTAAMVAEIESAA
ncbi:hypothetical protein A0H81_04762 [Grifola frondosa]|uniref:Uncharacterized protein n=1 Tax=Grifola frondosa TaxID=5627 RepID=A0A1C7MEX7_GRIFR|nr:hypothetical protein A0H81_04762 [Grifola frondosa]